VLAGDERHAVACHRADELPASEGAGLEAETPATLERLIAAFGQTQVVRHGRGVGTVGNGRTAGAATRR